jgi:site-specific recombinase XerD
MKSAWHGHQSPLGTVIAQYISYKRALGRKFITEDEHLRLFDRFLMDQDIASADAVTGEMLEQFLASRSRGTARSYNHLLGVVRGLFDWMEVQDLIDRSPLEAKQRRKTVARTPYLFDAALARQLLESAARLPDSRCSRHRGPTYKTIFALLYGLGLRVGEVSRLCIGDVDMQRQLLVIRQTKFSKDRLVPFGPRLGAVLTWYMNVRRQSTASYAAEAPLFSFRGGQAISTGTIRHEFQRIVSCFDLAIPPGVSRPRVHDLRHSFAVGTLLRWYREGLPPQDRLLKLSTFLGHVDPTSTSVYLTITADLLTEANRRFEKFACPTTNEVAP